MTKQELSKYRAQQIPTYQIDSLKKKNENLFAKADTLVDETSSCPRIKLSSSQTLKVVSVETLVIHSDFAQQLRGKKADAPENYFIFLKLLVQLQL